MKFYINKLNVFFLSCFLSVSSFQLGVNINSTNSTHNITKMESTTNAKIKFLDGYNNTIHNEDGQILIIDEYGKIKVCTQSYDIQYLFNNPNKEIGMMISSSTDILSNPENFTFSPEEDFKLMPKVIQDFEGNNLDLVIKQDHWESVKQSFHTTSKGFFGEQSTVRLGQNNEVISNRYIVSSDNYIFDFFIVFIAINSLIIFMNKVVINPKVQQLINPKNGNTSVNNSAKEKCLSMAKTILSALNCRNCKENCGKCKQNSVKCMQSLKSCKLKCKKAKIEESNSANQQNKIAEIPKNSYTRIHTSKIEEKEKYMNYTRLLFAATMFITIPHLIYSLSDPFNNGRNMNTSDQSLIALTIISMVDMALTFKKTPDYVNIITAFGLALISIMTFCYGFQTGINNITPDYK